MQPKHIYLLTGNIQTGKTTLLQSWAGKTSHVFGILTPVVNGERLFVNAATNEHFAMQAAEGDTTDALPVGRFIFSKNAFLKAAEIITTAIVEKEGWLLIDEVGPLELKGLGFANIIKTAIESTSLDMILVVRANLVDAVLDAFDLRKYAVEILTVESAFFIT